jgi:glycerol uptake facilitator-like aquaporin
MFVSLKRLNGLGLPKPDPRFLKESIYVEIIASFLFQFAFMSLYLDKRAPKDVHAIATGSMMALAILTIGHVSGGGMNPARAIGPAIISGNLDAHLLVFVGGPMAGSYLASFIYKELFMTRISNFTKV